MNWVKEFNERHKGFYSNKFNLGGKTYRIKPFQNVVYTFGLGILAMATNYIGVVTQYSGK